MENCRDVGFADEMLSYFLNIVFTAFPEYLRQHLRVSHYDQKGKTFKIQMQGSTLLCGMCALNNVFGDTIFEPELLNFIADLLWLEQASVHEIGTEFEKLRSESGSYNIDVLISAAKHAGFSYVQKTAALLNFFKNVKRQSSELDSTKLLTSFMRTLGIASGQRMLLNTGSEHYVVLVFYEDHCIILDSIHGVQALNATSTIEYLWRESQSPSFGCTIFLQTIFIAEDENTFETPKERYSVTEILKSGSKIADSIEISETYKHVNAHDLRCLKSQGYVNDAIISSVSMAINASCQGVFAVDSQITTKLVEDPNYSISRRKRKSFVDSGKKRIIFPVNSGRNHWWVLSVDVTANTYCEIDSLSVSHRSESNQLLKALSLNNYENATSFSKSHIVSPQQGTNTRECGMFAICAMVCQARGKPLNYTLFDMSNARHLVAKFIVDGKKASLASSSLWEGN